MFDRYAFVGLVICGLVFLSGCGDPSGGQGQDLLAFGLDGWEVVNGAPDTWQFKDGVLFTDGKIGRYGNWISTTEQYGDFALELECKLEEGGNSGVFVRVPRSGDGAYLGMEIQLLDDHAEKWVDLKPWQYTGSIYDVVAPSQRVTKPAGQWQHMVIMCQGARCRVVLNGIEIVDANLDEVEGKSKRHVGLKRHRGYIGFQNHKDPVWFRNVRIRELY